MRLLGLVALIAATIWFGFINGWLDRRPVQRLLFLGHSYTYYNDMPFMVAKMADSAGSPARYHVTMQAFPNASVEDHWNNPKSRALLAEGDWDKVILQPDAYVGRLRPDHNYFVYGTRLLAGAGKSQPAIIVSWTMSDRRYDKYSINRFQDFDMTEGNHRALAFQTGAQLIDVARVWEDVRAEDLPFPLYKDGNHPSLQGSYLAALVVYAELSQTDVANVTYVPWGMSTGNAKLLRDLVHKSLHKNRLAGLGHAGIGGE